MRFLSLFLFCFFSVFNTAQTQTGNIETYLNNYLDNIPGSSGNDYQIPTAAELQTWNNIITSVATNNLAQARAIAVTLNYRIVQHQSTSGSATTPEYWILEELQPSSKNWGTYVFNPSFCRNIALQAPHTQSDINTGKQAIYTFIRTEAVALFLAGTHRCNSTQLSSCSGTITSCTGNTSAYPVSDQAHSTDNMFQETTKAIHQLNLGIHFLQLHGFNMNATDPYLIMSYGARTTPSFDPITLIEARLQIIDPVLTVKAPHIDTSWSRLVGFNNVQGRFINNSSNPCNTSATSNDSFFMHIEQERTRLRLDVTGWEKLSLAIQGTFTCSTLSNENILQQKSFNISTPQNKLNIKANFDDSYNLKVYDLSGRLLQTEWFQKKILIDTSHYSSNLYIVVITSPNYKHQEKVIFNNQ